MIKTFNSKNSIVNNVFSRVSNKYDLMNDLMSFGVHRLWKRDLISWLNPQKNTKLIDVASGTGDIALLYLKEVNFQSSVFCLDSNKKMLDAGKEKLGNLENIKWFNNSAEKLPFEDNYFDYYTISFGIRNVSSINITLKEAYRVLKPGGRFICLEFSKVNNVNLQKIYSYYSKIIPKIGQFIVGSPEPYEYLTSSIKKFYNQKQLVDKILFSKFKNVNYRNLSNGIAAIHSAWKI